MIPAQSLMLCHPLHHVRESQDRLVTAMSKSFRSRTNEPDSQSRRNLSLDEGYRNRLRRALRKHCDEDGATIGWIVKWGILPKVSKEEFKTKGSAYEADKLRRKLIYWAFEEGDVKDLDIVALVEDYLLEAAPSIMAQFTSVNRLASVGRALASFVSLTPQERRTRLLPSSPHYSPVYSIGVAPGVYEVRSFLNGNRLPETTYLVLAHIGDKDYLVCQHFEFRIRGPRQAGYVRVEDLLIIASKKGFLFPYADPPTIIMRSSTTGALVSEELLFSTEWTSPRADQPSFAILDQPHRWARPKVSRYAYPLAASALSESILTIASNQMLDL